MSTIFICSHFVAKHLPDILSSPLSYLGENKCLIYSQSTITNVKMYKCHINGYNKKPINVLILPDETQSRATTLSRSNCSLIY